METFEFKTNFNTPYVKTIRFIGAFMVGLAVGVTLIKLKTGNGIDWFNTIMLSALGFSFALFPRAAKKQSLTIDEEGLQTHHYTFHWRERKEIKWENISAIGVSKSRINIKNNIGSSERIKLPYHTKEQVINLKAYLKEITKLKKKTFLA